MTALRDIPRGEPVTESYGFKGNREFLMFYGFVLRENQHNDLAIRVPYNKEDPLYKEKLRLAEVKRESDVEFKEFTLHAQLEGSK